MRYGQHLSLIWNKDESLYHFNTRNSALFGTPQSASVAMSDSRSTEYKTISTLFYFKPTVESQQDLVQMPFEEDRNIHPDLENGGRGEVVGQHIGLTVVPKGQTRWKRPKFDFIEFNIIIVKTVFFAHL